MFGGMSGLMLVTVLRCVHNFGMKAVMSEVWQAISFAMSYINYEKCIRN
jgi:phage-related holin